MLFLLIEKNCVAVLLSVLVVSCASTPSSTAPKSAPVSLLYVQTASSGTFEPVAGSVNKYRLVLNGVSPSVAYFSDRPNRMAGHTSTNEFLKGIGFGGKLDPNAAIDIHEGSADADLIIATLDKPAYDAPSATLSYEVSILETPRQGLAIFSKRMDKRLPPRFGTVALFIDSASCLNYGCTPSFINPCCPGTYCQAEGGLGGIGNFSCRP